MTPERYQLVKSIFLAACEAPPADRNSLLDRHCGNDSELRTAVERMLNEDDDALRLEEGVMTPTRLERLLGQTGDAPDVEHHPERVGPYRILRVLGEGGFGLVYAAEQDEPIRRTVAVKVLKLGMDSREVIARFDVERQALAMMDHPNIARVFDAGTTAEGRPYFVMELVPGIPITEYCDQHALQARQRLDLFLDVCSAVQHAHQKGVIHRDLKPSNVLVAQVAGLPVPKVIDFGIAKATNHRLARETMFTRLGQLMGTPEYMSPEQAETAGLNIDTRSDIYSLGAVLYEILTGTTPFDRERLLAASYSEIQRIILEELPPRPSTRLARTTLNAPSLRVRSNDPARLARELRGELDWITMKCLEKEPARRYDSASALAADLRRFLQNEPVLAGPPGAAYRFRKFARRNRVALSVAVLMGLAVVVGTAGLGLGLVWARQARLEADRSAARALAQAYRASVNAAGDAILEYRLGAARLHLEETPEQLRGWEHRHVTARLDESVARLPASARPQGMFAGAAGDTYLVLLAPVGNGHSPIGVIEERSVATGAVVRSMQTRHGIPRTGEVVGGTRLVTLEFGPDPVVVERDLHDLRVLRTAPAPDFGSFFCAAADVAAYRIHSDVFAILDMTTGERRRSEALSEPINALRLDPSGGRLAIADAKGSVSIIDARTLLTLLTLPAGRVDPTLLAFDPGGRVLAIAARDGAVHLWNVDTDPPVRTGEIRGHQGPLEALAFSLDGSTIATAGSDGTARLWKADDGSERATFALEPAFLRRLAILANGSRIITAGEDAGSLRLWDAEVEATRVLSGHRSYVYPVVFSPDGATIISGGWDGWAGWPGALRWWDAGGGDPIASTGAPGDIAVAACVARATHRLIVAFSGVSNRIDVFDLRSGARLQSIPIAGTPDALATDPDGQRVICADRWDGMVRIVDLDSGEEIERRRVGVWSASATMAVAWSNDGGQIAVARVTSDRAQVISLWNGDDLTTLREWQGHDGQVRSASFSRDGTRLLTAGADATARVWDTATGRELASLQGHGADVLCAIFSPDGRRIATGGRDSSVRIWDGATYEHLVRLGGHTDYVYSLDWSPDGTRLVSGSGDGTVRIWDVQSVADRLEARASRRLAVERLTPAVRHILAQTGDPQLAAARLGSETRLSPADRRIAAQVLLGLVVKPLPGD